ncbi:hypothetical protein GCK32_001891 [Trichostrongylus colubriformis]|uniref:Uncharacterized protein n=1 Tax=Trichostrongylus colubriformis TaxID=6319 RepID=A0AAN8EWM5_TRICO
MPSDQPAIVAGKSVQWSVKPVGRTRHALLKIRDRKQRDVMICDLPPNVKCLFPKENLEFAGSISENEAKTLKEVFAKHSTFDEIGEMIEAVEAKSPELSKRMRDVLAKNCSRLNDLTPAAVDYSKKCIHFVTNVMCNLTLGKQLTFDEADKLHKAFKELSTEDQAALKKKNPDVNF